MAEKSKLFESPSSNATIDPHFLNWKNSENLTASVSEAFNICQQYLDNDFIRQFSQSFYSRLWELYVCYTLLNSPAQNFLKPTNGKGPDFILEKYCLGKNIYIECVCPHPADSERAEGNLVRNETYSREEEKHVFGEFEGYSSKSQGYNEPIVARYANSINSKAIKFNKEYQYAKDHYKILCISGVVLGEFKSKEHSKFDSYLSTKEDFRSAVCPEKQYIEKHDNFESSSIISKPAPITIKRGNADFKVGHQGYLQTFHAIIFSDIIPFNTVTSGRIFDLICFNEEAAEDFPQAIKEIFK